MNCELYLQNLKDKFEELDINKAVIGLSGGKDSNIVAKLMVDLLGKENVVGVMIPNGGSNDSLAEELVSLLGIKSVTCDIGRTFDRMCDCVTANLTLTHNELSEAAYINIAPRLRMTVLYAVAQSLGGGYRVIGTTNRSENYIGWLTKWGDGGVDVEPIINLTVRELHELGLYIGLPEKFVKRVPVDGLTPATDEERFGFTYEQLDTYIHTEDATGHGTCGDPVIDAKIERMHQYSEHKRNPIPDVRF